MSPMSPFAEMNMCLFSVVGFKENVYRICFQGLCCYFPLLTLKGMYHYRICLQGA